MAELVEPIRIDHSTKATFESCREKARLRYKEDLIPVTPSPAPSFGVGLHAGIAELYRHDVPFSPAARDACLTAFLKHCQSVAPVIPLSIDSDIKHSVERGVALLEAYMNRYQHEHYEIVRDASGRALVEIPFEIHLMDWPDPRIGRERPVHYVGAIDRVMRSRIDDRVYIVETKSTGKALNPFLDQVRPNHQITGYYVAARTLLPHDIAGIVWDAIFVSTRKPGSPDAPLGVDIQKDFGRRETTRSDVDVDEWFFDVKTTTLDYLTTVVASDAPRSVRSAPTACYVYGKCDYLRLCASNLNPDLIRNFYVRHKWDPLNRTAVFTQETTG